VEHRLRVFDGWVLKKILGLTGTRQEDNGEDCVTRSFMLNKYYMGDQVKKNEMGGACGKYGRQERCIKLFRGKV